MACVKERGLPLKTTAKGNTRAARNTGDRLREQAEMRRRLDAATSLEITYKRDLDFVRANLEGAQKQIEKLTLEKSIVRATLVLAISFIEHGCERWPVRAKTRCWKRLTSPQNWPRREDAHPPARAAFDRLRAAVRNGMVQRDNLG